MKKIIAIALSLMLTIGILSSFGVVASASETANRDLPEATDDFGRIPANTDDLGLYYDTIWSAFPDELEQNYENGVLSITDDGFTDASFWSYLDYKTYQLTLVDGKWQCELPQDVGERGGLVYVYSGAWEGLYRGGTKEGVYLDGENDIGIPYKVEVMSHIFRIWTLRYVGYVTFVGDAYYTLDGKLDYLQVERSEGSQRLVVYFNAQREATMAYDGSNYMFPDGNWYSNSSKEEIREPSDVFAGMSFEEVTALVPCLLYCGNHQLTEYNCEVGQYCTVCYEVTKGATYNHNWTDATCTSPKTCTTCGEISGEPTGHSYDSVVTEPTCENGGYTTYTCGACGDVVVADEVDALGHDWVDEGDVTVCSICGESQAVETTEESSEAISEETSAETVEETSDESSESTCDESVESEEEKTEDIVGGNDAEESESGDEASGCASSVGVGAVAVVLAGVCGAIVLGKKKED